MHTPMHTRDRTSEPASKEGAAYDQVVNFVTKLRRLWRSDDPETVVEEKRSRAWKENMRDRQRALEGPRGMGGPPPPQRDYDDPRR